MTTQDTNFDEAQNEELNNITPENTQEEVQENTAEDLLNEEKNKYVRLYAEFDNFKKRAIKEKLDTIKYSNQEILSALLPVLDDFSRAVVELEKSDQNKAVLEGVNLIYNKFSNILSDKGLSKIEVNAGDAFDIDLHEAITQIPAPSEDLKNKIIDVVETGYKLNDKVVRFAKVVVGK